MYKKAILPSLIAASQLFSAESNCCNGPHHMRVALRHIEAGGIGYKDGYTTLETFLAPDPDLKWGMPFLDARAHVSDQGRFSLNAGLGARAIWGCRAYGINGYYDYRNTKRKTYNQVGLGLETLGALWDLRINGYLPVGSHKTEPYHPTFGGFFSHYVLVDRKIEQAMKGADGEIGFHFGKTANFDFYAAAGPYYFKGPLGKAAVGGKGRVAWYYKEYIGIELSDSWDTVFHNNFQGQFTISVPFGPRSRVKNLPNCCPNSSDFASALAERMVQPVARQEIIVIDKHTRTDTDSNYFIFVNNLSHSDGTFESPYPTLNLAETNSSAGDYIYVFSGDGTTTGMSTGITLKDNQKFWGSGVSHTLNTQFGMITIPKLTSDLPIITSTSGNGIILANGVEVVGLNVSRASQNGIFGRSVTNVLISESIIAGSGSSGISMTPTLGTGLEWTFSKLSIFSNGVAGISLTISNDASASFIMAQCSTELNTNGVAIAASDTSVIHGTFLQNSFSTNLNAGLTMDLTSASSPATTFLIENNSFTMNTNYGINVLTGSSAAAAYNFNILGNSLTGNYSGISITYTGAGSQTTDVSISNNLISNCSNIGINIGSSSGAGIVTYLIDSNTIFENYEGIEIFGKNTVSTFATVSNNLVYDHAYLGIGTMLGVNAPGSILVRNNTLLRNSNFPPVVPGDVAGFLASTGDAGAEYCLDVQNNNSDTGYFIDPIAATTINLAPNGAAGVAQVNVGTVYTGVTGTITSVSSCP